MCPSQAAPLQRDGIRGAGFLVMADDYSAVKLFNYPVLRLVQRSDYTSPKSSPPLLREEDDTAKPSSVGSTLALPFFFFALAPDVSHSLLPAASAAAPPCTCARPRTS